MSTDKKKRNIRTIGVNFAFSDEGDFVYKCLAVTKEQEDRSMSNVIFRILKGYFNDANQDFKEFVQKEIAFEAALTPDRPEAPQQQPSGQPTQAQNNNDPEGLSFT